MHEECLDVVELVVQYLEGQVIANQAYRRIYVIVLHCIAALCSALYCSAVLCNTVQCSPVHYSAGQ